MIQRFEKLKLIAGRTVTSCWISNRDRENHCAICCDTINGMTIVRNIVIDLLAI